MSPSSLALAATLALAAPTAAQVIPGMFGYLVTGQNGTAGEFCWQFDCTPRPLRVVAGETLTLRVNAPLSSFFAIGASFSGTSCLPVPGVMNALVLDPPIVTLALGVVSQSSPILACWGGYDTATLALPGWLPPGLSITSQAVAVVPSLTGPNGPSLSAAVETTVQ
ncbi:MAG: hypothetical protein KDE27_05270 [Planctomycetes bacterium]|nr:hypothetical protein [Planctomycetota bacterium]